MASFILPVGYPKSTGDGYLRYVGANMASSTLSTIGGVLSMQSLLFAIGLGAGAIPTAAALNWVIKDGLGQFGGVLFASLVSNRFDTDPKRWRVVSSLAMEGACLIELLTPLAPGYFLLLASFANVSKNIAFLSASASRAAIHKSFAVYENLADITAKTGSQSILSSMLGTGLGVAISAAIANDFASSLAVFSCCSVSSLALSYYALQNVRVKSLSLARLERLMQDYVSKTGLLSTVASGRNLLSNGEDWESTELLTPEDVRQEEVLLEVPLLQGLPALHVGAPLQQAFRTAKALQESSSIFIKFPFLVTTAPGKNGSEEVFLLFEDTASTQDVLEGHLVAYVVRCLLAEHIPISTTRGTNTTDTTRTCTSNSISKIDIAADDSVRIAAALVLGARSNPNHCRANGSTSSAGAMSHNSSSVSDALDSSIRATSSRSRSRNRDSTGRVEPNVSELQPEMHAMRSAAGSAAANFSARLVHNELSEWSVTSGMLGSDIGRYTTA